MASLLSSHLDQISLCAQSISDLSFPPPKSFTNALLAPHDITALIRDTEAHERALFHLAPPAIPTKSSDFTASIASIAPTSSAAARRATTYPGRQPKSRAVAAVLGGDLYQQTRHGRATGGGSVGRQKGDVDVEVLLEGAEKLAAVYPIPGATDRIAALRQRHQELLANIAHYEDRVSRNTQELQFMNRPTSGTGYGRDHNHDDNHDDDDNKNEAMGTDQGTTGPTSTTVPLTKADLRREEEEIRELEAKKRGLEERVTGMERDLGGLAR